MIDTIATISVLDRAITSLDDGRPRYEIKDSLKSYRDKLQSEVDEFDKWAEVQSNIDTGIQLEIDSGSGQVYNPALKIDSGQEK